MIGSVALLYPLELDLFSDQELRNTVESIRRLFFHKNLFFHPIIHSGYNIYLSLQLAQCLFRLGDLRGARRILRRVLEVRTPFWTYPEAIHPRTGGGVMGDGFHGWAFSEILLLLREFVIHPAGEELRVFAGLKRKELLGAPLEFGPFPIQGCRIRITGYLDSAGGEIRIQAPGISKTGFQKIRIHLPNRLLKNAVLFHRGRNQELSREGDSVCVDFPEEETVLRIRTRETSEPGGNSQTEETPDPK